MAENNLTAPDQKNVQINMDDLRPSPEKTARAHRNNGLLMGAISSIGLGTIAYAVMDSQNKRKGTESIPAWAVASVVAVVGGIIGKWAGSKEKTYEEEAYDLVKNSTSRGNAGQGLQKAIVKKLKERDEEAAMMGAPTH